MITRIRRDGNGVVMSLPKGVRETLGLMVGDVVIIRLIGRRAIFGKFNPANALPLSDEEVQEALRADGEKRATQTDK